MSVYITPEKIANLALSKKLKWCIDSGDIQQTEGVLKLDDRDRKHIKEILDRVSFGKRSYNSLYEFVIDTEVENREFYLVETKSDGKITASINIPDDELEKIKSELTVKTELVLSNLYAKLTATDRKTAKSNSRILEEKIKKYEGMEA